MEIQGLTPIDTFYEYVGLRLGLRLSDTLLWNGYFVGFVVAGAVLYLYYAGSRRGSYVELAVYPLYVLVIAGLLWPMEVDLTPPGGSAIALDREGRPIPVGDGFLQGSDVRAPGTPKEPAPPSRLRVPRLLALETALVDAFQENMIRDVRKNVGLAAFEWLRISAINRSASILDPALRYDLGVYLSRCYWPAVAAATGRASGGGANPASDSRRPPPPSGRGVPPEAMDPWNLVPFSGLGVDAWLMEQYTAFPRAYLSGATLEYFGHENLPCSTLHRLLEGAIGRHLQKDPFHQKAMALFGDLVRRGAASAPGTAEGARFYRRRLLYNEIFVAGGNEAAAVREALPEYSLMKDGTWDSRTMDVSTYRAESVWEAIAGSVKNLPGILASIPAAASEWWTQKALGPSTYYRVSALGPYLYGFILSFLMMLFPVAGLMAFWPRWWTAIVNFLKVLVSVKLWPVLWSFLSGVLSARIEFDPRDPEGFQGTFGREGMLPGLVAMYLMAPFVSYLIVSIAARAGGATMGALVGAGSLGSGHWVERAVETGAEGVALLRQARGPAGGGAEVSGRPAGG